MGYKIKDTTNKFPAGEGVTVLSSKERFLFFVEENRRLVWGGIILILVLFVVAITLTWLAGQNQERAWELEGKAQTVYLDRPLDDAKKAKENIQKASTMFQEVLDQYPGTTSAKVSLFLLGNSLMEEQKYEGAIEVYNSFVQQYSKDFLLVGLVQQRLGLAHLLNGNRDAALNAFDAVLTNGEALNKDQVIFELAKLAESDEKPNEAVGHYKKLMKEYPLSPFTSEAGLRVKVLAPEESQESVESESETNSLEKESEETSGLSPEQNPKEGEQAEDQEK